LQLRGELVKALQMCDAALRLDPGNEDVLLAMELVRHGEQALTSEPPAPEIAPEEAAEREEMADTVRQIAHTFEQEQRVWQAEQIPAQPDDPVALAVSRAQDALAEEIFREDEDEPPAAGSAGLSKLERDALLGQGMDFQARGQTRQAISCYEKAIAGGLRLPAALFTLGLLYLEEGQAAKAKQAFARAAQDSSYIQAIRLAWQKQS
jgi:tetratricopeptide (TPR) repeat protein